jgi:hypothetical protein
MSRKPKRPPPKQRNLAAKALRSPLFRPRTMASPNAYKRHPRFEKRGEKDEDN